MKKLYPILIMLLFASSLLNAQQWHVWDATTYPGAAGYSASNTKIFTTAPDTLIANPDMPGDSIYQMVSYPAGGAWMWKLNYDSSTVKEATMVARVKGVSDTLDRVMEFDFQKDGYRERLFIYNDNHWKLNQMSITGNLNANAQAWHIYRITMDSNVFKAYLDGNPVPFAEDTTTSTSSSNYFRWGDGNSSSSLGADVDWVIWSEIGAYAPGQGDPIPDTLLTTFASANASLSALTSDKGTFTPAFNADSMNYVLEVPVNTSSVTLTATTSDTNATVTGDGTISSIPDTASVVVTAQDGTQKTYSVIIRTTGTDASLSDLTVSNGTLNPAFDPATQQYAVRVPSSVTSVKVMATPNDTSATVVYDTAFTNIPGNDTIVVTAPQGNTMTYVISFAVMSSDATLSGLTASVGTLDPAFDPNTTSYTLKVPYGTSSVQLLPTTTDSRANAQGAGTITGLPKTVNITVTAEDGTTKTYTVDITVLPSSISYNKIDFGRMYPNPANTSVTFEFDQNVNSIEIYDVTGVLIQRVPVTTRMVKLNVSAYKTGLYYVKLKSADKTMVTKLIIN